jgi:hypothetical protein
MIFFSTVNDSLYTPRNFSSQLLPLLARHFKTQRPAVIQIQLCLWHSMHKMIKLYIWDTLYGQDLARFLRKWLYRLNVLNVSSELGKNVSLIQMLRWNCSQNNLLRSTLQDDKTLITQAVSLFSKNIKRI